MRDASLDHALNPAGRVNIIGIASEGFAMPIWPLFVFTLFRCPDPSLPSASAAERIRFWLAELCSPVDRRLPMIVGLKYYAANNPCRKQSVKSMREADDMSDIRLP
jgi:hypothetical protein